MTNDKIASTLAKYSKVEMICPICGKKFSFDVPINFQTKRCNVCKDQLDPIQEDGFRIIDHLLMRRLISTCYRYPKFAQKIVELYKRDCYRATSEEMGIDKSLLLIHAANSLAESGHRSAEVFLSIFLFLIPIIGFRMGFGLIPEIVSMTIATIIPLYLISRKLYGNLDYASSFAPENYNPTHVPERNHNLISKINYFTNDSQPQNLFFFSTYNPFVQFGENDSSWSFLIDRRRGADGEILPNPIELDIDKTYSAILNAIYDMRGLDVYRFRFYVHDILLIDGRLADAEDTRFFGKQLYGYRPKNLVKTNEIHKLKNSYEPAYRVFKRITFYNSRRQLCMRTFIRLQHQNPFTYIECIGTQLLPLTEKLFDNFQENATSQELEWFDNGSAWWTEKSIRKKKSIAFLGLSMLCILFLWFTVRTASSVRWDALIYVIISLVIIACWSFGYRHKNSDLYGSLLNGDYSVIRGDRSVLSELRKIAYQQEAHEFDFSPPRAQYLRTSQGRPDSNSFFESIDVSLLRRTQDLAIQEAFFKCLEAAGIDTSEFRAGITKINNYGIINSGKITGKVKAKNAFAKNTENSASAGEKK